MQVIYVTFVDDTETTRLMFIYDFCFRAQGIYLEPV